MKKMKRNHLLFIALITLIISCKQNEKIDHKQTSLNKETTNSTVENDSLTLKVKSLMIKHNVPGTNIVFIENGKLNTTRNYGVLQKGKPDEVNNETMFSVGSISKVVTAILTLKMVKDGKLDLDQDINNYLSDWKVKQNKFSENNSVTLRHLLSHTAGFSVHGFADFYPDEKLPTTLEILNGTSPAKNKIVELIFSPGSDFKYSGGGITVVQKIIEDVTGFTLP